MESLNHRISINKCKRTIEMELKHQHDKKSYLEKYMPQQLYLHMLERKLQHPSHLHHPSYFQGLIPHFWQLQESATESSSLMVGFCATKTWVKKKMEMVIYNVLYLVTIWKQYLVHSIKLRAMTRSNTKSGLMYCSSNLVWGIDSLDTISLDSVCSSDEWIIYSA